jgi:hypothetical protein
VASRAAGYGARNPKLRERPIRASPDARLGPASPACRRLFAVEPVHFYRRGDRLPTPATTTDAQRDTRRRHARPILCAACRAPVTTRADRTTMRGEHEHYVVNPHGYDFRVGCYRSAPGCLPVGEPSADFSWFPGFRWQIALCAACSTHLGWRFTGGNAPFFALIIDRLDEEDH